MLLRCLNERGVAKFAAGLEAMRRDPFVEPRRELLEDAQYTDPFPLGAVEVEPRGFANRREFARYIDGRIEAAGIGHDVDVPGMWEWLTLFHWSEVCGTLAEGGWDVRDDVRYVVDRQAMYRSYRHLLREPYVMHRMYRGTEGDVADVVLCQPLNELGDIVENICNRGRLKSSLGAMRAARKLFYDDESDQSYPSTRGAGGFRDFCKFVQNLPAEFDVAEASEYTLLSMLPAAFDSLIWQAGLTGEIRDFRSEFGVAVTEVGSEDDRNTVLNLDHIVAKLQEVGERQYTERKAAHRSSMFRTGVVGAYDNRCAVSGMGLVHDADSAAPLYEVHASHIVPVASGGHDRIDNGLALNRTIHWAFDHGMIWVAVNDDLRVRVADEVRDDRRNEWLAEFEGRRLRVPQRRDCRPSAEGLRWHAAHVAGVV